MVPVQILLTLTQTPEPESTRFNKILRRDFFVFAPEQPDISLYVLSAVYQLQACPPLNPSSVKKAV